MLICVGIPVHDGKPCAQTVDALLAEQFIGFRQGVHILVQWQIGTALIGIARNKLAKQFLDIQEASCMVFVDADISWAGGDLIRLARQPHEVIGATYRPKHERETYHVHGKPEPVGDLYKVDGLPGGFLKVSRKAFESIPAQRYRDSVGQEWCDYFPTGVHDGVLYGEDYGFCRLWHETGGSVLLDPSIILKHHGGLNSYTGDPAKWLKEQQHGAR
jgi:hypothetical protein